MWIDGLRVRAHRDPPPGRGALAASLSPEHSKSIFLYWEKKREGERDIHTYTERESERKSWEKSSERKSETKNGISTQTALMAGIWFAATLLVFRISTFVSSARIYPPNEGKVAGRKEAPRTSDFIHSARPRRGASVAAFSRGTTESFWLENLVTLRLLGASFRHIWAIVSVSELASSDVSCQNPGSDLQAPRRI